MLTFQKFTKKNSRNLREKKLSWENDWLERLYKWAYKKRRLVRANEPSACGSKYTIGLWEQIYHRLEGANVPSACGSKYTIGLWEQICHRLVRANMPSACGSKYTTGLWEQIYHRLVGANIPSACRSKYTIGLWEQIYHRLEGANIPSAWGSKCTSTILACESKLRPLEKACRRKYILGPHRTTSKINRVIEYEKSSTTNERALLKI